MALIYIVYMLLVLAGLSKQQANTPEERCNINGAGSTVCIDCFTSGTCSGSTGSYIVTPTTSCTAAGSFCDDSYAPNFGKCSPYDPNEATCGSCNRSSPPPCIQDPNDPSVILICGSTPPTQDCGDLIPNLSTCTCSSSSSSTSSTSSPSSSSLSSDASSSESSSSSSSSSPSSTISSSSSPSSSISSSSSPSSSSSSSSSSNSSSSSPSSSDSSSSSPSSSISSSSSPSSSSSSPSSSSSSTSTATTTSTPPTSTVTTPQCTPDCPYHDDPNDSCKKFVLCDNGMEFNTTCPGSLCFNQTLCDCVLPSSSAFNHAHYRGPKRYSIKTGKYFY